MALPFTAGDDYTAVSGTFTFTSIDPVQCVEIPIIDDFIEEPTEVFGFFLSALPGSPVVFTQSSATICIQGEYSSVTINTDSHTVSFDHCYIFPQLPSSSLLMVVILIYLMTQMMTNKVCS